MYVTMNETVGHNLGRSLTLFGTRSPEPDTWFTGLASHMSEILTQPLGLLLDHMPRYAEPKDVTVSDQILGWLLYALNSMLWGAAVYLVWYGFERHKCHRTKMA